MSTRGLEYKVIALRPERTDDPTHTARLYETELAHWQRQGWEVVTSLGSEGSTTYVLLSQMESPPPPSPRQSVAPIDVRGVPPPRG